MKLHTPLNWGSYEPGQLEMTMAILLHQSRPRSFHRTPSQGDGGVDVADPLSDGRFDVFQIKGFTGRLKEGTRKKQVKDSFDAAVADPRLQGPIHEWTLVLPIDLTSGEEDWFNELTSGAPFDCCWKGEAFWHSEAATYPYVVDYYLLNRREEVEGEQAALLSLARGEGIDGVEPLVVAERMRELAEFVNRTSPHYQFDFHVTQEPPVPQGRPGLVFSYGHGSVDGDLFTTVDVIARFPQATEVEPITGTIQFNLAGAADSHPGFAATVEEWFEYGPEITIPPGLLSFSVVAPGGLGTESDSGGGWIGVPELVEDHAVRLVITTPEGEQVELPMSVTGSNSGVLGGREIHIRDAEDLLSMRFRFPADPSVNPRLDFTTPATNLAGRLVKRLQPTIAFLAAMQEGSVLQVLPEAGNAAMMTYPMAETFEVVGEHIIELVAVLSRLQNFAAQPIRYPAALDGETMHDLRRADELLAEGEIAGTWTGITLTLSDNADEEQLRHMMTTPQHLVLTGRLEIDLDGQLLDLGPTYSTYYCAFLDALADDLSTGHLSPGEDDRCVERVGDLSRSDPAEIAATDG